MKVLEKIGGFITEKIISAHYEMPPELPNISTNKKRKRESTQNETNDPSSDTLLLEARILESRRYYNNIVTLLGRCRNVESDGTVEESALAMVALCRTFCRLLALGNMSKVHQLAVNEVTIVQWLNTRYSEYKDILMDSLAHGNTESQGRALMLLMRLIKDEARHLKLSEDLIWRTGTFAKLVKSMVDSSSSEGVHHDFIHNFVNKYEDIRFHTLARLG